MRKVFSVGIGVMILLFPMVVLAATLSGTVIDEETGDPIPDAWVDIFVFKPDSAGNGFWEWWDGMPTNPNGVFSFSNVTEGEEYVVHADRWGSYYGEWYDDVYGMDPNKATVVVPSPDVDIVVDLMPTPVRMDVFPLQGGVPSEGGRFRYVVDIVNTTDTDMDLKAWINVSGPAPAPLSGETDFPVLGPVRFTLPAGEEIFRVLSLNVPPYAADGFFQVNIYIGPVDTAPWELTVVNGVGFQKGQPPGPGPVPSRLPRRIPRR
ncbi:MAG: carboxypeptidase regulatory-like domain-containing protein [Nitrospinota bacterium]|nr:MAG: carboxypeptidase regulatory-like domain-containing protein [Nitrospinota bacterium]